VKSIYEQADASKVKEHVVFQFNIEGEAEGAFYVELADGVIHVEPYEYFDRDILVTTTAATLLDIVTDKLDIVKAYTTGAIRAEGDLGKAMVLKQIKVKKSRKKK
jgi:putative sterol carrier protein